MAFLPVAAEPPTFVIVLCCCLAVILRFTMTGVAPSPQRGCGTSIRQSVAWFAFLDRQLRAGHNGAGLRIRCRCATRPRTVSSIDWTIRSGPSPDHRASDEAWQRKKDVRGLQNGRQAI